ncbi:MAG TPA: DUF1467 family protein [Caulobacteraceae bacterium]|jgi:predicted secreted protein|nr:DUF1467 family protein [Caulobacteraceae bacterium]
MNLATSIAAYLVIWWTALFAILPLGARSHWEAGIDTPGGGDPSSPVNPNLKRKFVTTTWVSAILFAMLWLTLRFHLVHLPHIPAGP